MGGLNKIIIEQYFIYLFMLINYALLKYTKTVLK